MNALITNNALQLIALPDSRPQARIIFNKVELYNALILFALYIVHIFLMKFSSKYEVAIK